jgi:hypothetical protein
MVLKKMIEKKYISRFKELAGIISENKKIEYGVGLIMKLDENLLSELNSIKIPIEPNGFFLTILPSDKKHITLTSIKSFNPFKTEFKLEENIIIPNIILGVGKFVYRHNENGEVEKVTYVISIKNQQELKHFVDKLYSMQNLENPEPNRLFHITIANNFGGDSFKSIGDVNKNDFI